MDRHSISMKVSASVRSLAGIPSNGCRSLNFFSSGPCKSMSVARMPQSINLRIRVCSSGDRLASTCTNRRENRQAHDRCQSVIAQQILRSGHATASCESWCCCMAGGVLCQPHSHGFKISFAQFCKSETFMLVCPCPLLLVTDSISFSQFDPHPYLSLRTNKVSIDANFCSRGTVPLSLLFPFNLTLQSGWLCIIRNSAAAWAFSNTDLSL